MLRTYLPSGFTLFRSRYGGPAGTAPGCHVGEGEVRGRVVVQYLPKRCLPYPTTPVVPETVLRSQATGKLVGFDRPRSGALYTRGVDW